MVSSIIILIYITMAIAVTALLWSVGRKILLIRRDSGISNGIHTRKIRIIITVALILTLAITFITGDTAPIQIATNVYNDIFWLKIANMFVTTTIILTIATSIFIAISFVIRRKG